MAHGSTMVLRRTLKLRGMCKQGIMLRMKVDLMGMMSRSGSRSKDVDLMGEVVYAACGRTLIEVPRSSMLVGVSS